MTQKRRKPSVDRLINDLQYALLDVAGSISISLDEGWQTLSIVSDIPQSQLDQACQTETVSLAIKRLHERVGDPFQVKTSGGCSIWFSEPDGEPSKLHWPYAILDQAIMPCAIFHLGRRNDSHNRRRSEGRLESCFRRCSGIRSRMDRSPLAAHLSI